MFQGPSFYSKPALKTTVTTAHLMQTMALLELSAVELRQKIEAELSRNPALELKEENRCPICHSPLVGQGPCPRCTVPKSSSLDEPIVFVTPRDDFHIPDLSVEEGPDDNFVPALENLPDYVLRQISTELHPEDRSLAAHILTNLDEDGLLDVPLIDIARYHHVPLSRVEQVLHLVQRAEPIGVGSPSAQDALLVQLEILSETRSIPLHTEQAIQEGMDLLSRHQYIELGRLLNLPTRQVKEIAQFIVDNLNPFPARAYWGDVRMGSGSSPSTYNHPDVIISMLNGVREAPLVVEIITPYAGRLQVNPLFRQSLSDAPPEKSEQWHSDLERADLLVKCLQQRTNTIVRLMRRIIHRQRNFILDGDEFLHPMTRACLAEELEVHESTISRAVSSKTVQFPNGHIIPLSKFFDRSLHIRTIIKEIIGNEKKPLSDHEIVERLRKQGYSIARRTVAKYRAMEGILPSHLRQPQKL
jgi:RNA polymerase sigma-54 factor